MLPNSKQKVELPEELRKFFQKGIIKSMEFGDRYILIHIEPSAFFREMMAGLAGQDIEIIAECRSIMIKVPVDVYFPD